ncbi:PIH1 domain-containing protein 1 [Allomyces javanicus]|nr:PIH1 domain-containing protein 1 [Allomyces javanicus]
MATETNHLSALSNIPTADKAAHAEWEQAMQSVMSEMKQDPELQKSLAEALQAQTEQEAFEITPMPGFAIKTSLTKSTATYPSGFKVFINLCHSPYVPAPPVATDDEIRAAITGADGAAWKVPMSLTGPRDDADKLGRPCVVFDACVHSDVVAKAESDWDFKQFIIELAIQWAEEKHGMSLSREFALPKMKSKGPPGIHKVYRAKRAGVATIPQQEPLYQVKHQPDQQRVTVLVKLPLIATAQQVALDIEEHKVELDHKLYRLSVPIRAGTVDVDHADCDAVFDKSTRVLQVTLPLVA